MDSYGALYLSLFLMGAMGGLHCLGMCGPLVLALPFSPQRWQWDTFTYHLGRTSLYALLGAVAGALGLGASLLGIQRWVTLATGALLLMAVVLPTQKLGQVFLRWIPFRRLAQWWKGGRVPFFVLGMVNGLLPCGLVYAALLLTLSLPSPWYGALGMGLFGLATWPALVALMMTKKLVGDSLPLPGKRWYPLFLGLVGGLLILRGLELGIPFLSPHFSSCH